MVSNTGFQAILFFKVQKPDQFLVQQPLGVILSWKLRDCYFYQEFATTVGISPDGLLVFGFKDSGVQGCLLSPERKTYILKTSSCFTYSHESKRHKARTKTVVIFYLC